MAWTHRETEDSRFVVLMGIGGCNVFWSTHEPGADHTKLGNGVLAYRVLAYCETEHDAQDFLYGAQQADELEAQAKGWGMR